MENGTITGYVREPRSRSLYNNNNNSNDNAAASLCPGNNNHNGVCFFEHSRKSLR